MLTSSTGILTFAVTGSAAIGIGVQVHRPPRRTPWYLLATALVLLATARFTYETVPVDRIARTPPVSTSVLYLLACVLFIAAVSGFARSQTRRWDWSDPIDISVLLLAAGLLAWITVGQPWWRSPDDVAPLWVRLSYLTLALLVLAAVTRVLLIRRAFASVLLLAIGVTGLLALGTVFVIGRQQGAQDPETAVSLGSILSYAAVSCAALVPSMRRMTTPTSRVPDGTNVGRLALVATVSLIPSLVLIVHPRSLPWRDTLFVSLAASAMMLLVLIRLIGGAIRLRRQIRMERVARLAVAELADASNDAEVAAVVDRAVANLTPSHETGHVALLPLEHELTIPGGTEPMKTDAAAGSPKQRIGVLEVDRDVARPWLRGTLETISGQTLLALDRIRMNHELVEHARERHFAALAESATDVILIVDDSDRIRYASPSARTLFDRSAIRGTSLLDLVDESDRRGAESLLRRLRSDPNSRNTSNSADWSIRKVDGGHALTEVTCRDLRDEESVRGIVVTLRDVTDQRRLETELTRWAFHDALTGLPNRRFFDERVAHAIATDRGITGVVAVDLDNFKLVNDGLGHEQGDAALRITADRLRDAFPGNGFAARLGGDEFAVLVQNLPDADAANAVAARICDNLAQPMSIGGSHVSLSASVGVATTADIGDEGLLRHADLALYAAKEAGRGHWRRYEPAMTHAVVHRLDMHSSLGRAMASDELTLEYQPIIALSDHRTVGFEALLRWDHPTRGRLMPASFIGVAEEAGLIFGLGRWVLARAMRVAASWSGTGRQNEPYVAVNVSPLQFRWPGFVDDVYSLCEANDLPPYRLMLEITESLLLRDDEEVWQDMERLRRWGVRIAIDDFGTGYSALSYLRQEPLDVVKLDRLFTNTMTSSSRQRKLVEGIVRLARAMDLKVVAEGVETEAERDVAAAVGCAYGQGYLFARPMAEAAVDGWLAEQANAARSPRSMRGGRALSHGRSNLGSALG